MLGLLHGPDIFPAHLVKYLNESKSIIEIIDRFCDVIFQDILV